VISCTSGPPTSSGCEKLIVAGHECQVCYDVSGGLVSQQCKPTGNACIARETDGELCLVCATGGKETSRECKPASQTCKSTSTATEICLECSTAAGKLVSKSCQPLSQQCTAEVTGDKVCLVCRDGAGEILSTTCHGGEPVPQG